MLPFRLIRCVICSCTSGWCLDLQLAYECFAVLLSSFFLQMAQNGLLDERISDGTLDPSTTSTSIGNACESIDVDLESAST